MENTPQAPSSVVSVSDTSDPFSGETTRVKKEDDLDGKEPTENVIKSCIKKLPTPPPPPPAASNNNIERKKVQWIDNLGKELAEIREFESR